MTSQHIPMKFQLKSMNWRGYNRTLQGKQLKSNCSVNKFSRGSRSNIRIPLIWHKGLSLARRIVHVKISTATLFLHIVRSQRNSVHCYILSCDGPSKAQTQINEDYRGCEMDLLLCGLQNTYSDNRKWLACKKRFVIFYADEITRTIKFRMEQTPDLNLLE